MSLSLQLKNLLLLVLLIFKEQRFIEYQIVRCNYPGFIPIIAELEQVYSIDQKFIGFKLFVGEEILVGHLRNLTRDLIY